MTGFTAAACATCGCKGDITQFQVGQPMPLPGERYPHIYRCRDWLMCQRRVAVNLWRVFR